MRVTRMYYRANEMSSVVYMSDDLSVIPRTCEKREPTPQNCLLTSTPILCHIHFPQQ